MRSTSAGMTLWPSLPLMGQTFEYQFDLNNSAAASSMAPIILAISIGFTMLILRLLRVAKGARI